MPAHIPGRPFPLPWDGQVLGITKPRFPSSESIASMIRSSKHHLSEVDESYFEHMGRALGFSLTLAKATLACGLHAVVPGFCAHTASSSVAELQAKLVMRAARKKEHGDRHHLNS